jgi:2,3-bisphosphoglycerate-dependent phosphoglycerate mutase
MKIVYLRHGESTDDLDNQFGGWADFELTENGRNQAKNVVTKLKEIQEKFNFKFDMCLHSPLKRASEVAKIVSEDLNLSFEELAWLKEKNGYGLLTGMEKEYAKSKYPELYKAMIDGYNFGSEPEEKFIERVKISHDILKSKNQNILAVTHGVYLKKVIEHIYGKKYVKAGDCGFMIVDTDTNNIVFSDGIEFSEN